jgi:two-component system chemotaxis response regulator CheY
MALATASTEDNRRGLSCCSSAVAVTFEFAFAPAPLHKERTLRKLKILIVDASAVMRKIIECALRQAGLDLGEVQKDSLDIILSGINVPVMDALEFLQTLPTIVAATGVTVIMISTEGSEARVVEALCAGVKGYLREPVTPEQVKERVGPLLAGIS